MPREEPYFKKFCYCIPLKTCLQVWSCTKIMADLSIGLFLTMIVILMDKHHELRRDHFTLAHMFLIIIVALFTDSLFMVVLTVGLCTNNLRMLRVFLYYGICMMFIGCGCILGIIIYLYVDIYDLSSGPIAMVIILAVCGLINTGLDVCIFFTLKSEMIKLRNKQQYEFVQMPTLNKEEETEEKRGGREEREPAEPFQADTEYV